MDSNSNQNTTLFTNVVNNTGNMGTYDQHNNTIILHDHHHDHRQIPMGVSVNVNYPHHMQPSSSSNVAPSSSSNNFLSDVLGIHFEEEEEGEEELGAMKEMMYKMAAMQPVDIDPASVRKPKRRNVRISEDPQSVAARHRRERISEKIRILQRLVPGGTKMDTASMLDEAIRYVKFLKRQIRLLQSPPPPHSQLLPVPPSINTSDCPFAPILFNDSSTRGLGNDADYSIRFEQS